MALTPIDLRELHLAERIHDPEPSFQFVQKGRYRDEEVAIKWFLNEFPYSENPLPAEKADMALLPLLSDREGFPRLLGVAKSIFATGYVMKYFMGGSIRNAQTWTLTAVKRMVRQILKAMEYLHSLHWAHGDLKLENILCDHLDVCNPNANFVLTDFGWSFPLPWDGDIRKLGGTTEYLAPELAMWLGERECEGAAPLPDGRVDIWSLGVMIERLLDEGLIVHMNSEKKTRQFISRCKDEDAGSRPDATTLLKDVWLKKK